MNSSISSSNEAQVTGSQVTGSQVTGSQVTGSQVTGSQVTGSQVTGSQVTGSQVTGSADGNGKKMARGDFKALAVALALLLIVEVGIRVLEPSLSADVRNIEAIPETLSELAAAPGEHILLLGNSMTRQGVDMQELTPALGAQGVGTAGLDFGLVYPDSADMLDWFYVYRHNVTAANRPDVLVVNFAGDALASEPQADNERVRRLARHHTTLSDTPYVFSHDLKSVSERSEFLISKVFASFAHRERIRARILDDVIPNYRDTERTISQGNMVAAPAGAAAAPPSYNYDRLERFIKLVGTQEVKLIFVAMPLREPYTLDPELPQRLERAGAHFVDLESVPQLNPSLFEDNLHLTPAGAKIYSRVLAQELAPLLSQSRAQR